MSDPTVPIGTDIVGLLRYRAEHGGPAFHMEDEQTLFRAADEIERLRAIIRVNGLRAGSTHAEIDQVIYGR